MTIDEAIRQLERIENAQAAYAADAGDLGKKADVYDAMDALDVPGIIALLRSLQPSIGLPHGEDMYVVEWRSNDGAISHEIDSADSAQEYDAATGGYDDEPDHQIAVRYIPLSALFPRT